MKAILLVLILTGIKVSQSMHFSRGAGIYMLSSKLNIRKPAGYNNEILISNIGMKIASNENVNKAEAKSRSSVTIFGFNRTGYFYYGFLILGL